MLSTVEFSRNISPSFPGCLAQGQKDSNPQPSALEADAQPVELYPYVELKRAAWSGCPGRRLQLFAGRLHPGLLVEGVIRSADTHGSIAGGGHGVFPLQLRCPQHGDRPPKAAPWSLTHWVASPQGSFRFGLTQEPYPHPRVSCKGLTQDLF